MNDQALKLAIDALFDAMALGKSIQVSGLSIADLVPGEKLFMDMPGLIANMAQVKAQGAALDPQVEADLVAYVAAKLSGDSVKAQAVVSHALALSFSAYELVKVIEA